MDSAEILKHIDGYIREAEMPGYDGTLARVVAVAEFLRIYAGEKSEFFRAVKGLEALTFAEHKKHQLLGILRQYRNHVAAGLHEGVSPERQAKMDVVSDFLGQAGALLSAKGMHPACAVMLAGASLEAFLREWAEAENIRPAKPGLDGYAESLLKAEKLTNRIKKT